MGLAMSKPKKRSRRYTVADLEKLALKCGTRNEFRIRYNSAYIKTTRLGLLDSVCSHMPKPKQRKYRTSVMMVGNLLGPAFKYEDIGSFIKNDYSAYLACLRNGFDLQEFFDNKDDVAYLQKLLLNIEKVLVERVNGHDSEII